LNRVEKISDEIKEKSEQLAQNGESTPYITKGTYLFVFLHQSTSQKRLFIFY